MDEDKLAVGARLIAHELHQAVEVIGLLDSVNGARSAAEEAWLDAFFLHERCLIGFLCGNYSGRWHASDIKPEDFLGDPWTLPDDELDRQLRGRLPIINKMMSHLTWEQATDETAVMWSATFLAHEITYAIGLFTEALGEAERPDYSVLASAVELARESLPAGSIPAQTPVPPAPPRPA